MNKQKALSFVIGLALGNKGVPVIIHLFYLSVIAVLSFFLFRG